MWSKQIITEGQGDVIPAGSVATVHYVGRFLDGREFDSSRSRGVPFQFSLHGGVIRGWIEGVATMKKGEKCLLTCPPEYAYGSSNTGPIPPNSTLVFEIELFGWN